MEKGEAPIFLLTILLPKTGAPDVPVGNAGPKIRHVGLARTPILKEEVRKRIGSGILGV
jgi:hypothetical protein